MRVAFQRAHVENEDKDNVGWGRRKGQTSNINLEVGGKKRMGDTCNYCSRDG